MDLTEILKGHERETFYSPALRYVNLVEVEEAERNGFRQSGVSNCCAGRIESYKGYIWKFKETY